MSGGGMGLDPTPGINAGLPDEASGVSNDGRSRGTLATYGNSGGQVGPIQSVEPSRRSRVLRRHRSCSALHQRTKPPTKEGANNARQIFDDPL